MHSIEVVILISN